GDAFASEKAATAQPLVPVPPNIEATGAATVSPRLSTDASADRPVLAHACIPFASSTEPSSPGVDRCSFASRIGDHDRTWLRCPAPAVIRTTPNGTELRAPALSVRTYPGPRSPRTWRKLIRLAPPARARDRNCGTAMKRSNDMPLTRNRATCRGGEDRSTC